jgi:gliding motility-associated-like protein
LNDTINGQLVDFRIITKPEHGLVVINSDKSLTYTPAFSFCEGVDNFKYFIENKAGRDTATVCVSVGCDAFVIFNGFSPNGDEKNETFTIQGIERYTENTVTIFNRWGNVLYSRESYRNEGGWDGSWNGEKMPDGTYFYRIDVPILNKTFTGFVEVRR